MKKLLQLLAHRINKTDGEFGVEIEVEGANLPHVEDGGWRTVPDNSLRNGGQEYIFDGPKALKDIEPMLTHLQKAFKDAGARPKFSFRTSVHVHMNVQQITYIQLLNLIYTYLLIEEPLMNLCGEERKGNRFCLRLADGEGSLDVFTKMFAADERGFGHIPVDKMRYAALNVEALTKYGSIEFRAMKGNMDIPSIVLWCNSLAKIKQFACKFDNPAAIYDFYIKQEAQAFFNHVLEELAEAYAYPKLVEDIQRNFSLSIDLPFSYVKRKDPRKVVEDKEEADNPFDLRRIEGAIPHKELLRLHAAARDLLIKKMAHRAEMGFRMWNVEEQGEFLAKTLKSLNEKYLFAHWNDGQHLEIRPNPVRGQRQAILDDLMVQPPPGGWINFRADIR